MGQHVGHVAVRGERFHQQHPAQRTALGVHGLTATLMVVNGLLIMRETVSLKKINTVLAATFILFILWFGTEYILSPETTAPGYGLPSWPSGDGDGFLVIKGIRDVVLALVPQPA